MPNWLITSIVLSIGATIALNLLIRLFPRSLDRIGAALQRRLEDPAADEPGVRVWFPWKWMIGGSVVLTLLLNLLVNR